MRKRDGRWICRVGAAEIGGRRGRLVPLNRGLGHVDNEADRGRSEIPRDIGCRRRQNDDARIGNVERDIRKSDRRLAGVENCLRADEEVAAVGRRAVDLHERYLPSRFQPGDTQRHVLVKRFVIRDVVVTLNENLTNRRVGEGENRRLAVDDDGDRCPESARVEAITRFNKELACGLVAKRDARVEDAAV